MQYPEVSVCVSLLRPAVVTPPMAKESEREGEALEVIGWASALRPGAAGLVTVELVAVETPAALRAALAAAGMS